MASSGSCSIKTRISNGRRSPAVLLILLLLYSSPGFFRLFIRHMKKKPAYYDSNLVFCFPVDRKWSCILHFEGSPFQLTAPHVSFATLQGFAPVVAMETDCCCCCCYAWMQFGWWLLEYPTTAVNMKTHAVIIVSICLGPWPLTVRSLRFVVGLLAVLFLLQVFSTPQTLRDELTLLM